MSSDGVETTNNSLQTKDGQQEYAAGGGYWFEIIELDDENESQQEYRSFKTEGTPFFNKEGNTPSCVTSAFECAWTDLPWNCVHCLQALNSTQQLIKHNQDVHKINIADITWVCADCQLRFRHYTLLINHMRRVHRENLALVCDICDTKSGSFKELDDHRREMHNDVGPILHCTICGSVYRNRYHLQRHLQDTHSGQRKLRYECNICNKTYRSNSSLADHQLTHDTPKFACEQCGKKFCRKLNLQKHLITHIKIRSFFCRLCPKSFRTPVELTSHLKSHKNSKRRINCKLFQCDICQRLFRAKITLRNHRSRCQITMKEDSEANTCNLNSNDQIKAETEVVINIAV